MASTPPQDIPKAPSPMRLSQDHLARLYKLTLEVSRALHREVTPTAILHVIIGYGLTMAEGERDLARKVRDGVSRPWRFRSSTKARRPVSDARATPQQKRRKSRDFDRRRQ